MIIIEVISKDFAGLVAVNGRPGAKREKTYGRRAIPWFRLRGLQTGRL